MSKLLLVLSLKDKSDDEELKTHIRTIFRDQNVDKIWVDPFSKLRAVVLLDRNLELKEVQNKFRDRTTTEISTYFDVAKQTQSVFVKTYKGLRFGTRDKLKYLFSSQRYKGRPVINVQPLNIEDDDCFEILFRNWDDVLQICGRTWIIEDKKLKVSPFFESFKKPVKQQLEQLRLRYEQNDRTMQAEKANSNYMPKGNPAGTPSSVWKLNQSPLKPLPTQPSVTSGVIKTDESSAENPQETKPLNNSFKGVHSSAENPLAIKPVSHIVSPAQTLRNQSSNAASTTADQKMNASTIKPTEKYQGKKTDVRTAKSLVEHPFILMLLRFLHFKEMVQAQFGALEVTVDENVGEVEIKGPVPYVKIVQKILHDEDEVSQPMPVKKLLARPAVQQELEKYVDSCRLHVDIVERNGKHHLQVQVSKEKQMSLHDFISSLVVTRTCCPLPDEQVQEHKMWTTFMESFSYTYSLQHIFVDDNSVALVSLAHRSEDLEVIAGIINNVIIQIQEEFHSKQKAESALSPNEISQVNSLSNSHGQMSGDTLADQTKKGLKIKEVTICPRYPLMLWFLNALHLKEAVSESGSDLDVDFDDDEDIIVKGVNETVQNLKGVLVAEDKKMPFPEQIQEFLCHAKIQQDLTSVFSHLGCHIVLDEELQIFVASKTRKQAQLWPFLSDLIQFAECSPLPEKYQNSTEWKTLIEDFQNNNQFHYVLTSSDNVYILIFATNKESSDKAPVVKKFNNIISNFKSPNFSSDKTENKLTSTMRSGESTGPHLHSDRGDKLELRSSKVNPDSVAKVLVCQSSFLAWILHVLNLDEAVKNQESDLIVKIDVEENEIILTGTRKKMETLESVIRTEDKQTPFTEQEQEFLNVELSQKFLESCFREWEISLTVNDKLEFFIANQHDKMPFRAFLEKHIWVTECSHLLGKWQTTEKWMKFKEDVHKKQPNHRIVCVDDKVCLLTTDTKSDDLTKLSVQEIKLKIIELSSKFSSHEQDTVSYPASLKCDTKVTRIQCQCTEHRKAYYLQFLTEHLKMLCKTYEAKIMPSENGFEISSTSNHVINKVVEILKQILSSINSRSHTYCIPGLLNYIETEGASFIENLCEEYKCLIVPEGKMSDSQQLMMNQHLSPESSTSHYYKVLVLETANCGGFSVHLVQGDMQMLNLDMKIEVQISESENHCRIKTKDTSNNLILTVPPWCAAENEDNYSYFEKLRASLHETVVLALEQAKYNKCGTVALSTTCIGERTENPFPADVIAKEVTDALFEKFDSTSDSEGEALDFYICEPKNETVFKAFKFFMKLRHQSFAPQNHSGWDRDCFKESYSCPNYGASVQSKKIPVEVLTSFPKYVGREACVFYPIHPSLDIHTSPAVRDPACAEFQLKSSITRLQHENPDGVLPCQYFPLNCFQDGRQAFIYCGPEWGMDYEKDLEMTLKTLMSAESEKVYIIPPGINTVTKCPVIHVVQTLFQKLDTMIEQLLRQKKKIYLIVENKDYNKMFQEELQKRCPKQEEKLGFIEKIINFSFSSWWGTKEKNKEEIPKTVTLESVVPKTTFTFWSTDEHCIHHAFVKLETHLQDLLKKNTVFRQLDPGETKSFEGHKKTIEGIPVYIRFEKQYDLEADIQKKPSRNKRDSGKKNDKKSEKCQKVVVSGASLKVCGLIRENVDKVLGMIHMRSDDKSSARSSGNQSGHSSAQVLAKADKHAQSFVGNDSHHPKKNKSNIQVDASLTRNMSAEEVCYEWLYENKPNEEFQKINRDDEIKIESAYKEKLTTKDIDGKKVESVNFNSMTAVIKDKGNRGILRTETVKPSDDQLPSHWVPMHKKNTTSVELQKDTEEYQRYEKILDRVLKENKLELSQIEQIQNKKLYRWFKMKQRMLHNMQSTTMWHRVSNNCVEAMKKNGCHPGFSGMPEAPELGEGILFFDDPMKCLKPSEDSSPIFLVACEVIKGTPGPGEKGLRCPVDKSTGKLFHSVCEEGACMVFSDKQAYPTHLIVLQPY